MTSTQQEKLSQVVTNLKAIHLQPTSKITRMALPLLEKDVTPGLQIGILHNTYYKRTKILKRAPSQKSIED